MEINIDEKIEQVKAQMQQLQGIYNFLIAEKKASEKSKESEKKEPPKK